jgi:hypothetical protein
LHHYLAIPDETKRFERGGNRLRMCGLATRLIDIFHAQQPTPAARAGLKATAERSHE